MCLTLLQYQHGAVPSLETSAGPRKSCVPLGSILNAWSRRGELSKETFLLKRKTLSIVVW